MKQRHSVALGEGFTLGVDQAYGARFHPRPSLKKWRYWITTEEIASPSSCPKYPGGGRRPGAEPPRTDTHLHLTPPKTTLSPPPGPPGCARATNAPRSQAPETPPPRSRRNPLGHGQRIDPIVTGMDHQRPGAPVANPPFILAKNTAGEARMRRGQSPRSSMSHSHRKPCTPQPAP